MIRVGVIDKKDMKLFSFADTPEEAFSMMKEAMQKIHSKSQHIGILHGGVGG